MRFLVFVLYLVASIGLCRSLDTLETVPVEFSPEPSAVATEHTEVPSQLDTIPGAALNLPQNAHGSVLAKAEADLMNAPLVFDINSDKFKPHDFNLATNNIHALTTPPVTTDFATKREEQQPLQQSQGTVRVHTTLEDVAPDSHLNLEAPPQHFHLTEFAQDADQDIDPNSPRRPCPCPRLEKSCADGSSVSAICIRNDRGICQPRWPPCSPIQCRCPAIARLCADGSTSTPICAYSPFTKRCEMHWTPCPPSPPDPAHPHPICECAFKEPIMCPDGKTEAPKRPLCFFNDSSNQCDIDYPGCPPPPAEPPVLCACPAIAKLCADGKTESHPLCEANANGDCVTTWSPCPEDPEPCPCPLIARLCPDGSAISPKCARDAQGICQTSWPDCPSK